MATNGISASDVAAQAVGWCDYSNKWWPERDDDLNGEGIINSTSILLRPH